MTVWPVGMKVIDQLIKIHLSRCWETNFVSIGDSISAFNSFYVQRITVLAFGSRMVDRSPNDFTKAKNKES
jgi:hypothetical protein